MIEFMFGVFRSSCFKFRFSWSIRFKSFQDKLNWNLKLRTIIHPVDNFYLGKKAFVLWFMLLSHAPKAFHTYLTLKAPITTAADDIHKYFSLFFREIKTWCFKWILCKADNSHKKSSLIFFESYKKKKLKCRLLQFLFTGEWTNFFVSFSILKRNMMYMYLYF